MTRIDPELVGAVEALRTRLGDVKISDERALEVLAQTTGGDGCYDYDLAAKIVDDSA